MTKSIKQIEQDLSKMGDDLGYLRDRWQDEREYEDWKEYEDWFKKRLPEGYALYKMTKRPFQAQVDLAECHVRYIIKVTGRYIETKVQKTS